MYFNKSTLIPKIMWTCLNGFKTWPFVHAMPSKVILTNYEFDRIKLTRNSLTLNMFDIFFIFIFLK